MRRAPLLTLSLASFLAVAGCVYAPFDLGTLGELGKEQEITLVDAKDDRKIALVKIDGEIVDHETADGLFSTEEGTVSNVKHTLEVARQDENVKAVLLRINSPGGGVTASDVIYHELKKFREETGRPVVALLMDTAASGGYYVAQAADRIVAHPTTVTGSIGVITFLPNVTGLAEKIGVKVEAIKSGTMKDMGNPFRPLEPADRKVFQDLIDQMYGRFVDVVADGRKKAGLSREQVAKLADGRVYTAQDALKAKLVDDIGYFQDALALTKTTAGLSDAKLVTYIRKGLGVGRHSIYSQSDVEPTAASFLARGHGDATVKLELPGLPAKRRETFNYLWCPELK
jgi:protease-4